MEGDRVETAPPDVGGKIPGFKWHLLAPLIAAVGGFFGILAAYFEEFQYGGIMSIFIAAPIIEEVVKPMGVYLLLAKWQLYSTYTK
jgi:hypothetical protein